MDAYKHTCGALLIAKEQTQGGPIFFDASFDHGPAHVQFDDPCPICAEPVTRKTIRPGYQPRHRRSYYMVINEWLISQGYQAAEPEVIDNIALPEAIRQRAEEA